MIDAPITGHDGPYPAPIEVADRRVEPGWIDYNGHMNVGYYGIAFDQAFDVMLEDHLGLGERFVRAAGQGPYVLQSHIHYLRELLEGEAFTVSLRLVDCDAKRLHVFAEMRRGADLCATQEALVMNVDHRTGRSAAYPDWAQRRCAQMQTDHATLDAAPQLGAPLGIRRR
jgi:acyl-CoA thioester hydrolase